MPSWVFEVQRNGGWQEYDPEQLTALNEHLMADGCQPTMTLTNWYQQYNKNTKKKEWHSQEYTIQFDELRQVNNDSHTKRHVQGHWSDDPSHAFTWAEGPQRLRACAGAAPEGQDQQNDGAQQPPGDDTGAADDSPEANEPAGFVYKPDPWYNRADQIKWFLKKNPEAKPTIEAPQAAQGQARVHDPWNPAAPDPNSATDDNPAVTQADSEAVQQVALFSFPYRTRRAHEHNQTTHRHHIIAFV